MLTAPLRGMPCYRHLYLATERQETAALIGQGVTPVPWGVPRSRQRWARTDTGTDHPGRATPSAAGRTADAVAQLARAKPRDRPVRAADGPQTLASRCAPGDRGGGDRCASTAAERWLSTPAARSPYSAAGNRCCPVLGSKVLRVRSASKGKRDNRTLRASGSDDGAATGSLLTARIRVSAPSAPRTQKARSIGRRSWWMRCCVEDEGCGPSESPCGGEAPNRLMLRRLNAVRGER